MQVTEKHFFPLEITAPDQMRDFDILKNIIGVSVELFKSIQRSNESKCLNEILQEKSCSFITSLETLANLISKFSMFWIEINHIEEKAKMEKSFQKIPCPDTLYFRLLVHLESILNETIPLLGDQRDWITGLNSVENPPEESSEFLMAKIRELKEWIKEFDSQLLQLKRITSASEDFDLNERESVLDAVKKKGVILKLVPAFQNDSEVVNQAVQEDGLALEFADAELQDNNKTAYLAVKNRGYAIRWVSKRLHHNPKLFTKAIKRSERAFQYFLEKIYPDPAFNHLLKSEDLQEALIEQGYLSFNHQYVKVEADFKELMTGGYPWLKNRRLALTALKFGHCGLKNLEFWSADEEFVIESVKRDPTTLANVLAPKHNPNLGVMDLRNSERVMLAMITIHSTQIKNILTKILPNARKDFVFKALAINGKVLAHLDTEYQKDEQCIKIAEKQIASGPYPRAPIRAVNIEAFNLRNLENGEILTYKKLQQF